MKRRNADCGKLRRPIKRNKITEGMYGSTTVLYMKFLILWAIVITADFMFMFRFEFLWPFWLLLRSVHDSFKYKGLAFSVLFVCIAITSDLVCLFFIPVHWLLFAASTYVWVQYVWHTDKGICLPTIILWMLFVYLEAFIRWKDSRHTPHLDLCRPFAAHCIGYPVVTLGFGFKSYVGYRMRQRKQREVAKENEFYMQLLQQALPQDDSTEEIPVSAVTAGIAVSTAPSNASLTSSLTTTATSLSSTAASIVNAVSSSFASNAQLTGAAATNGIVSAFASIANHAQNHLQQNNTSCQQNDQQFPHNIGNCTANSQHQHHEANNAKNSNHIQTPIGIVNGGGGGANGPGSGSGSGHNNSSTITATANGHIGISTKSQRRSMDKENKHKGHSNEKSANNNNNRDDHDNHRQQSHKNNNNNNYQTQNDNNSSNHNSNSSNSKDKTDWDGSNQQVHQTSTSPKEKEHRNPKKSNLNVHNLNSSGTNQATVNGNVPHFETDDVVAVEPIIEKPKNRRNRSKKDNSMKDNHHNHQHHNNTNNSNNSYNNSNSNNNNNINTNNNNSQNNSQNHHQKHNNTSESTHNNMNSSSNNNNSDTSSISSSSSTTSSVAVSTASSTSSATTATTAAASTISHIANKVVSKICESCLKLEIDVKKFRAEISHMKQIENELRQKLEANLTTKTCLQAKQKECEDLEKRIQELSNARHADMLQLQTAERRLTEERRQKQSLEAQLNNEKKARKLAEEKASRPECSSQCKQRKNQMDEEIKTLRRDLKAAEDSKQQAEQHGRKCEQELRICEQEIRNRDSKQTDTEMLMNALASLQDKNCTLEKNLSAETRVKLDLFSALGDAKRQLEISEGRRRTKEDEVSDLKAKIAQLIALLPSDSLCLPSCGSAGASSMLRMNDTPPLQTVPGPSSPMLNSLSVQQGGQQGGHQLSRNNNNDFVQQVSEYCIMANSNGPVSQQQCSGHVPVSVATSVLGGNGPSSLVGTGGHSLDPNASIYKPKIVQNQGNVGVGVGVGVVVGGAGEA